MKKKNRGFTLSEMVVVIGIIMVLTAFIFPKIRTVMGKAQDSKALEGVSALRRMSQLYKAENNKSFDPEFTGDSGRRLISMSALEELVKAGYLDRRTGDFFDPRKNGASSSLDETYAAVKVGSIRTKVEGECLEGIGKAYTYLVLESDGLDISFFPIKDIGEISDLEDGTEKIYYNSSCQLWYEK